MYKKIILVFFLSFLGKALLAQDITQGTWFNEEKDGRVQFYEQNGKLYGKIVWINTPLENGKQKVDKNNPDPKLRTKPLVGLVVLKDFKKDGENWTDGTVYDSQNGKTYSSSIKWAGSKQLNIRGYIGLSIIGRTTKFTKAD